MCCLSKAARDHLEIKQNLQIYSVFLSYKSFKRVRLQWEESSVAIPCHPPLPSPSAFCCSRSSLETVRSDNDDVHENVAEKWTSHPLKVFCDYPKSPCYLKEENFWNWKEGTAPEFRQRWYNLSPCCFRSQVQGCAGKAKKLTKKDDACAELLVCSLNPLLFWRSRCRRRCNFERSYCTFWDECIKLN